MTTTSCIATVRSAADKSLAFARTSPGTSNAILGYVPDGQSNYPVLESKADSGGSIWLHLSFAGGASGWVSADRLNIQGDCSDAGYGTVSTPTQASTLARGGDSPDRVRKASFNITLGFEGGAYNTYQNYDAGIVSYGRFGFTLASGSLASVLDLYLSTATSTTAAQLRSLYQQRVDNRDATLRTDTTLRNLLLAAASDPIMQAAQDSIATTNYWNAVQNLSIKPRNLQLALSQAFIFDLAINSGVQNNLITTAEDQLHVPERSRVPDNGITEQTLLKQVAKVRHDFLYQIANAQNLPGLKVRADFWVAIMQNGDWNLQGDANGNIIVKPGVIVQVRNP